MGDWRVERLSVVVPTYNRPDALQQVLAGLERQTWPRERLEVIVVDDGSSQPVEPVVDTAAASGLPVRLIRQENRGPAAARNTGIRAANGELVILLDDDCVPEEHLLAEHARVHTQPNLATTGRIEWHPSVAMTPLLRFIGEQYLFSFGAITVRDDLPFNLFYTANAAVGREVALQTGLFDEDFPRASWEDTEFALRLRQRGVRFVHVPEAIVFHIRGMDLAGFLRRERLVGREAVRFWRKHPELGVLAGMDTTLGENAEFEFYAAAARYARLIGMGEGLGATVPGSEALAAALHELHQPPRLAQWRDAYLVERERIWRQALEERQHAIGQLELRVAELTAREAELESRLEEQSGAYAAQTQWARELNERLRRAGDGSPLRRLLSWLRPI